MDVVVKLVALLYQEYRKPLVLFSIMLVPIVVLQLLVPMANRVPKAVEVRDVRLGEREGDAVPHVVAAKGSDIQVGQVHAGSGTPVVELVVGKRDLVVCGVVVPVDIDADPGRVHVLG